MIKMLCAVALAAASLSACITQPTLAQLDAQSQANAAGATATYKGYTSEQVRTAAFTVLRALSPNEMHFDVRGDRLLGTQAWILPGFPLPMTGQRWYEVKFTQQQEAVRVDFGAEEHVSGMSVSAPNAAEFHQDINVGSDPAFLGNAKVFFARMEYALGRTKTWPSCRNAEKVNGRAIDLMCGGLNGGPGISDKPPAPAP